MFVRKRSYGGLGATLATPTWGPSSGARSLIVADGVLLSALFANDNLNGGPRGNMIAPAEIARVDRMYGPFSAAYAADSMGAMMEITPRLPDRLEGTGSQTQAHERYAQYGTRTTYPTGVTQAVVGAVSAVLQETDGVRFSRLRRGRHAGQGSRFPDEVGLVRVSGLGVPGLGGEGRPAHPRHAVAGRASSLPPLVPPLVPCRKQCGARLGVGRGAGPRMSRAAAQHRRMRPNTLGLTPRG